MLLKLDLGDRVTGLPSRPSSSPSYIPEIPAFYRIRIQVALKNTIGGAGHDFADLTTTGPSLSTTRGGQIHVKKQCEWGFPW